MAFEVDSRLDFGLESKFAVNGLGKIFNFAVRAHCFNFIGGVNGLLSLGDDFDIEVAGKDSVTFTRRQFFHDDS